MKLFFALIILSISFVALPTNALARISMVGAVSQNLADYTVTDAATGISASVKGGLGYGGGLLLTTPLSGSMAFEFGGIYLSRKAEITVLGIKTETTTEGVYIPAGLGFKIGSSTILNLGGYYDLSMEKDVEDDHGAFGGLRFQLTSKMFLDARYNYGMKEFSGEKNKEVLGLLGFSF